MRVKKILQIYAPIAALCSIDIMILLNTTTVAGAMTYMQQALERTGSSEDDLGSSTEAPPDNEQCLEEDIDATSDYNRSEELYSVEGLPADHEESLCPEDEDEEKSIQESQQDHDEVEPTLKRSRH